MDTAFPRQLALEQLVDDAMSGGLHLGPEGVGGDYQSEVRLLGSATHHGLVVCVLVGVVEDLQGGGLESLSDLGDAELG